MRIVGICPTYRRPKLIPTVLEMWRRQDYPEADRHLIILDDGGSFDAQNGPGWSLFSEPRRFPTVGAKFSAIAGLAMAAGADAVALFEDDDLYFPWHLSAAAEVLKSADVSAPSVVLADDGGRVHHSNAIGRHHGAWVFRRAIYEAAGGYPSAINAGFDAKFWEQMLAAGAVTADPVSVAPVSYLYRWFSAGYVNGSAAGLSIYDTMAKTHPAERVPGRVRPKLDAGAADYFARLVSNDGRRLLFAD